MARPTSHNPNRSSKWNTQRPPPRKLAHALPELPQPDRDLCCKKSTPNWAAKSLGNHRRRKFSESRRLLPRFNCSPRILRVWPEGPTRSRRAHCARCGASIAREYAEVESGRHDDRPKLTDALAYARRANATLLVAKLDRLSRSVRFIATVLDSGADFAACDAPEANRLLLHVLAAVAEN